MSCRGISPARSAVPPAAAGLVPMATKWQMAKDTAAKVTVDLDREVEAKRRSSSKIRDLGAIEPVLEVKALPLWFEHWRMTANQVSVAGPSSVNSVALPGVALPQFLKSRGCIDSAGPHQPSQQRAQLQVARAADGQLRLVVEHGHTAVLFGQFYLCQARYVQDIAPVDA